MADWHPEDIKAAVRKLGITLADIARDTQMSAGALRQALVVPRADAERAIANRLRVHPKTIWPTRYDSSGARKRPQPRDNYRAEARFGNPA